MKFCDIKIQNKKIVVKTNTIWRAENRNQLHLALKHDLSNSPLKNYSISHTSSIGGYAISKYKIGFDIEHAKRPLLKRTLSRVCTNDEILRFSIPMALWVAKEASYKSLRGPKQPPVLSHVEVTDVKSRITKNETRFYFKFQSQKNSRASGRGQVRVSNGLVIGVALANRS